ncbi:hypothetical protein BIW11_02967 [Tropilaelaps mercedesae]|uniref:Uncharacterized protein n=1 Tax=Tropilaelaps mercedesae TaxID=418985 RepID=A0A1V9XUA8_9ACAR|nr:hypothetical protein BIW11_02967 [Tropilaelaps mercedesae]
METADINDGSTVLPAANANA